MGVLVWIGIVASFAGGPLVFLWACLDGPDPSRDHRPWGTKL